MVSLLEPYIAHYNEKFNPHNMCKLIIVGHNIIRLFRVKNLKYHRCTKLQNKNISMKNNYLIVTKSI